MHRFDKLNDWLAWQETLNPAEIDLGLERIEQVMQQAQLANQFNCPLIIVAGTNGKGSVVATLEAIARRAGYTTCSYTSPHIHCYNERIKINDVAVSDDMLCDSFARIDHARADVPLTYFEFGTLAAIDIFHRANADLIIMEIGLGGRLDAVNVMQPDISIITSIALDHTDWLGNDRESIAREKAGVMRRATVTVIGDDAPPDSLYELASKVGAECQTIATDFSVHHTQLGWSLQSHYGDIADLPQPHLAGSHQYNNTACALQALLQLPLAISRDNIVAGLQQVSLAGRLQQLRQQPHIIVDVAHNPQAVAALVKHCQQQPVVGKTYLVLAMLADKPVAQVIDLLTSVTDVWYIAGLDAVPRGLACAALAESVAQRVAGVKLITNNSVSQACEAAFQQASDGDRIIVTGSFYTVADALSVFEPQP